MGQVKLRLAIALWAKHARAVETDQTRLTAVSDYAAALGDAGEHADAARLQRGVLDARTRMLGPEHCEALTCASNLAVSLIGHGECAEAVVLLLATLAARTRTLGADGQGTHATESILVNALLRLGEYAEAEALGRATREKHRRVFGPDNYDLLATAANLAPSLVKASTPRLRRSSVRSSCRRPACSAQSTRTRCSRRETWRSRSGGAAKRRRRSRCSATR